MDCLGCRHSPQNLSLSLIIDWDNFNPTLINSQSKVNEKQQINVI